MYGRPDTHDGNLLDYVFADSTGFVWLSVTHCQILEIWS